MERDIKQKLELNIENIKKQIIELEQMIKMLERLIKDLK